MDDLTLLEIVSMFFSLGIASGIMFGFVISCFVAIKRGFNTAS